MEYTYIFCFLGGKRSGKLGQKTEPIGRNIRLGEIYEMLKHFGIAPSGLGENHAFLNAIAKYAITRFSVRPRSSILGQICTEIDSFWRHSSHPQFHFLNYCEDETSPPYKS